MSQINPASRPVAARAVQSAGSAGHAASSARNQGVDGQVLPQQGSGQEIDSSLLGVETNTRGHVDTQLGRAKDVLHRSIQQGRTDGAGAREYFGDLMDRGEVHAYPERGGAQGHAEAAHDGSQGGVEAYGQRRDTSANQLDRAADVLQRSVKQGRVDNHDARDVHQALQQRARGHVEG